MELIEAFRILKNKVVEKSDSSPKYPEELYLISLVTSYRSYIIYSDNPTIEKLSEINKKQSKCLLSLLKNIMMTSKEFKLPSAEIIDNLETEKIVDPHNILNYIVTNIKEDNYPFVYDKGKIIKIIKTIFKIIAKDERVLKDLFLKYAYTKTTDK
jgi:hypothetical protein